MTHRQQYEKQLRTLRKAMEQLDAATPILREWGYFTASGLTKQTLTEIDRAVSLETRGRE